jgi:hypothetical protein
MSEGSTWKFVVLYNLVVLSDKNRITDNNHHK